MRLMRLTIPSGPGYWGRSQDDHRNMIHMVSPSHRQTLGPYSDFQYYMIHTMIHTILVEYITMNWDELGYGKSCAL